jgi:hypothetical protein
MEANKKRGVAVSAASFYYKNQLSPVNLRIPHHGLYSLDPSIVVFLLIFAALFFSICYVSKALNKFII